MLQLRGLLPNFNILLLQNVTQLQLHKKMHHVDPVFFVHNLLNKTENLPVCLFGHQVGPLLHLGLLWLWSWLAKIRCQ